MTGGLRIKEVYRAQQGDTARKLGFDANRIRSITADAHGVLYLLTDNGAEIYMSTDLGITWQRMSLEGIKRAQK